MLCRGFAQIRHAFHPGLRKKSPTACRVNRMQGQVYFLGMVFFFSENMIDWEEMQPQLICGLFQRISMPIDSFLKTNRG